MDKAEWDVMEARDAIVATAVMGYVEMEVTKAEMSLPAVAEEGRTVIEFDMAKARMFAAPTGEHVILSALPRYTTDRNACALVLDEIDKRNDLPILLTHLLAVTGETDVDISGRAGSRAMCNLLYADPDTICYCAVKAVEDATK